MAWSCLYNLGIADSRDGRCFVSSVLPASFTGLGVLIPATTSSPWALGSHSPKNIFSPVAGFLVKATPVAELSPVLPKTIDWTFTAVPHSSGIFSILRYDTARFPIHD